MDEKPPSPPSSALPAASPSSRWNPTKEQIAILEGLYWQGIRTPTAEQIQHITSKLREFGSIEGKNVFYWFQNHKARQRQKQKQESFTYFGRLLHRNPPPPPPPPPPAISCSNVVCAPFCLQVPQVGGVGLYKPQYPHVYVTGGALKRPLPELQKMEMPSKKTLESVSSTNQCSNQTLQLFPLHPTGILEKSESSPTSASKETERNEESRDEEAGEIFPVIDFFGDNKS